MSDKEKLSSYSHLAPLIFMALGVPAAYNFAGAATSLFVLAVGLFALGWTLKVDKLFSNDSDQQ